MTSLHDPPITKDDIYLFNEGRHFRLYQHLGAHCRDGGVAFAVEGVHPHDVATILDGEGIAIRAGHHCCQPLMHHLGVPALGRASFYVYTRKDDVDALVEGVKKVQGIFG